MKQIWLVSRWWGDGKGNAVLGSVAAVSKALWMIGCAHSFHAQSLMHAAHLLSHWSFLLLLHNYDQPSIHRQHCNRAPNNTFIVSCVLRRPLLLCFMLIQNSQGQLGHYKCTVRLRPLAPSNQLPVTRQTFDEECSSFVFNTSFNILWEWGASACTILNHTAAVFLYWSAWSSRTTVH